MIFKKFTFYSHYSIKIDHKKIQRSIIRLCFICLYFDTYCCYTLLFSTFLATFGCYTAFVKRKNIMTIYVRRSFPYSIFPLVTCEMIPATSRSLRPLWELSHLGRAKLRLFPLRALSVWLFFTHNMECSCETCYIHTIIRVYIQEFGFHGITQIIFCFFSFSLTSCLNKTFKV